MIRLLHIIALASLVLAGGCVKDDLDPAELTNNPFDKDYDGPAVFNLVGTYTQVVNIGVGSLLYQVVEFTVREDLFLAPATYGVQVTDLQSGQVESAVPEPPGGNTFKYYRQPLPGQQVCLELRLTNNNGTARAETLCVTL